MVGRNRWRCTARNTIKEEVHEESATVVFEVGELLGNPTDISKHSMRCIEFHCLLYTKRKHILQLDYDIAMEHITLFFLFFFVCDALSNRYT